MKKRDLTTCKIASGLLFFAAPFLLSLFIQNLYSAVDLFVVGQFASQAQQTGVSIGSQYMFLVTFTITGLSVGGTVLIGKNVGNKNQAGVNKAIGNLAVIFVILALFLTVVSALFTGPIIQLLQTPDSAYEATFAYTLACSLGIPFIGGYNVVNSVFRGMGDSKTPLLFVIIACICNVGLDFLLVCGFKMGALGAALATSLSQAISFIFALIYGIKKKVFAIKKSDFVPEKRVVKDILTVGVPIALQDILVTLSFLIIMATINSLGDDEATAVGVTEKIIGFLMLVPAAFSQAVATMSAQNLGAGKKDRALKVLLYGVTYSFVFGAFVSLYCWVLPQTLTVIFTNVPQVVVKAGEYLKSYALDCVLVAFIFCPNAYFGAVGKSYLSFVHSILATFAFRIPFTFVFASLYESVGSLTVIGYAAPIASVFSTVFCLVAIIVIAKKENVKLVGVKE